MKLYRVDYEETIKTYVSVYANNPQSAVNKVKSDNKRFGRSGKNILQS